MGWAADEFDGVDLGDKRLDSRLVKLFDSFSEAPESPINRVPSASLRDSSLAAPYPFESWTSTRGATHGTTRIDTSGQCGQGSPSRGALARTGRQP